jgi:hypothetical protein
VWSNIDAEVLRFKLRGDRSMRKFGPVGLGGALDVQETLWLTGNGVTKLIVEISVFAKSPSERVRHADIERRRQEWLSRVQYGNELPPEGLARSGSSQRFVYTYIGYGRPEYETTDGCTT